MQSESFMARYRSQFGARRFLSRRESDVRGYFYDLVLSGNHKTNGFVLEQMRCWQCYSSYAVWCNVQENNTFRSARMGSTLVYIA